MPISLISFSAQVDGDKRKNDDESHCEYEVIEAELDVK